MTISLKELLESVDSLSKLINKELPVKAAYRLGRLTKAVRSELDQFNLTRNTLLKKYGKEKDGQYQIDTEDKKAQESFNKEIDELLNLEIKINDYEKISIEELGDIKLSPIDMNYLIVFFKD